MNTLERIRKLLAPKLKNNNCKGTLRDILCRWHPTLIMMESQYHIIKIHDHLLSSDQV